MSAEAEVILLDHPQSHLDRREWLQWIRENLLLQPKLLVGQNLKFDLARLARASGGPVAFRCLADDSMMFHYMVDESPTNRSLDYLSRRYTEYGGYKEIKHIDDLSLGSVENLVKYNGTDAVLPVLIRDAIIEEMKSRENYSPWMRKFYQRVIPFVACMESAGVHVDKTGLDGLGVIYELKGEKLLEKAKEMAPDVNLDSPKQLSNHLYNVLKIPVPDLPDAYTEKGQPSTKESVLAKISHPLAETITEFRKTMKLKRTYIDGIDRYLKRGSNMIYPEFYLATSDRGGGTVTGRLSCKNPAMQTIPKGSELRGLFNSRFRNEGILLDMDASQMELRYAAILSGDERMLAAFREGEDLHQITATEVGCSRKAAKIINFGIIYGITIAGLIANGLAPELARQVNTRLRNAYPGLFNHLDETKVDIVRTGEVCTRYGRIRRLPGANMGDPKGRYLVREGVNFTIQAPASDFTQLLGWWCMQNLGDVAYPILSVHDELVFDCHKDNREEALKIIEESIKQFPVVLKEILNESLPIPLCYDMAVGDNWLDCNPVATYSTEVR